MMDNRLKRLKKSMKKTVFRDLTFTESDKNHIKAKLASMNVKSDEEITIDILQLLTTWKTGFDLTQNLQARGVGNFDHEEGQLYMYLHRLEQKAYLESHWEVDEKMYRVTNKGRKLLRLVEKKQTNSKEILKEILEG